MSFFTEEQNAAIIASLSNSYGLHWNGYVREAFEELLARLDVDSVEEAAEHVRNYVWDIFPGGGASANATRAAFKSIGMEEACSSRWI